MQRIGRGSQRYRNALLTPRVTLFSRAAALQIWRDVAKIIAEMSISGLERIAKSEIDELMPRWADLSTVWTKLLQAEQDNVAHASSFVALHALQLAATEQAHED